MQVTGVKLHTIIAGETMATWNDNPERYVRTHVNLLSDL